jgi:ribosome recycling factor
MSDVNNNTEAKMKKTIIGLEEEFATIRAGRANPAVLDKIKVDYYGVPTPINQMAAIAVTEARALTIQPWDTSSIKSIEKAIQTSDLGVNPQNDGRVIRLVFPQLTEDHRKELVKNIGKMAEEAKIAIRNHRREAIDTLKENEKKRIITEDDLKDEEKKIQDLTDKKIKEIDGIYSKKEKELMEI